MVLTCVSHMNARCQAGILVALNTNTGPKFVIDMTRSTALPCFLRACVVTCSSHERIYY